MKNIIMNLQGNHIFRGIASLGNILGTPTVRKRHNITNDIVALRSDWETIGKDMRTALTQYCKEAGYVR